MKNRKTSSEIQPATFQNLAQCLNKLRHSVPPSNVLRLILSLQNGLGECSWYSDSLRVERPMDRILVGAKLSVPSRPALGPNQPPVPRVLGLFPDRKLTVVWC